MSGVGFENGEMGLSQLSFWSAVALVFCIAFPSLAEVPEAPSIAGSVCEFGVTDLDEVVLCEEGDGRIYFEDGKVKEAIFNGKIVGDFNYAEGNRDRAPSLARIARAGVGACAARSTCSGMKANVERMIRDCQSPYSVAGVKKMEVFLGVARPFYTEGDVLVCRGETGTILIQDIWAEDDYLRFRRKYDSIGLYRIGFFPAWKR